MPYTVFPCRSFKVKYTDNPSPPHITAADDYRCGDSFLATVFLKGRGVCFVDGESYIIEAGDMVLIGPECMRSFRVEQTGEHERLSVYLSADAFLPLLEYDLQLDKMFYAGGVHRLSDHPRIWEQVLFIRDTAAACDAARQAEVHLAVLQLLVRLSDVTKRTTAAEPPCGSLQVREICRYIADNLGEKLDHASIKAALSVSRYQLTQIFPRYTGMTLTEYILQKRILRATELVRQGFSLTEAAAEVGFSTYSHFYKEFRRIRGVSPGKYFSP